MMKLFKKVGMYAALMGAVACGSTSQGRTKADEGGRQSKAFSNNLNDVRMSLDTHPGSYPTTMEETVRGNYKAFDERIEDFGDGLTADVTAYAPDVVNGRFTANDEPEREELNANFLNGGRWKTLNFQGRTGRFALHRANIATLSDRNGVTYVWNGPRGQVIDNGEVVYDTETSKSSPDLAFGRLRKSLFDARAAIQATLRETVDKMDVTMLQRYNAVDAENIPSGGKAMRAWLAGVDDLYTKERLDIAGRKFNQAKVVIGQAKGIREGRYLSEDATENAKDAACKDLEAFEGLTKHTVLSEKIVREANARKTAAAKLKKDLEAAKERLESVETTHADAKADEAAAKQLKEDIEALKKQIAESEAPTGPK